VTEGRKGEGDKDKGRKNGKGKEEKRKGREEFCAFVVFPHGFP